MAIKTVLETPYETFLAIVRGKTVHKAAELLYISQTAVTHRLKNLEDRLNVSLFYRTSKGMVLTEKGKVFLDMCLNMEDVSKQYLQRLKSNADDVDTLITIHGATSVMRSRIIPLAEQMLSKYDHLSFRFNIVDNPTMKNKFFDESAQQIFIMETDYETIPKGYESVELKADEYVLVGSPSWKALSLEEIILTKRIVDFFPGDQITFNYLKKHDLYKSDLPQRIFANNTEVVTQLLCEGYGYGVLTKTFAEEFLDDGALILLNDNCVYKNRIAMAWRAGYFYSDYFKELIDVLKTA